MKMEFLVFSFENGRKDFDLGDFEKKKERFFDLSFFFPYKKKLNQNKII